jgi:Tfp pilus assembly protein PilO
MANSESFFDKYNMSAGERRLVMSVLLVLVAVLAWMAFDSVESPAKTNAAIAKIETDLKRWETERANHTKYKGRIRDLEGMSSAVAKEEQEVDMGRTVNKLEGSSGINVTRLHRVNTSTNDFFIEKSMRIDFSGKENEIVDFLWKLGEDDSLVRVSEMRIKPDKNRTRLEGWMRLTSSYQKNFIAQPPAPAGEGTAKPSGTSEPSEKPSEPAKPAAEPEPVVKEEPETKPGSNIRSIPTRRVRTTQ